MTYDKWHVTHDTWQMTHDMWQVGGGEPSLKMLSPYITVWERSVLKIFFYKEIISIELIR